MRKVPETFWAYLAGFVDGEGTLGLYLRDSKGGQYKNAVLVIPQKDRSVLDEIQKRIGEGAVTKRGKTPYGSQMWSLQFGSRATRKIAKRLMPYLILKKDRAEEVINWKAKVRSDSILERKEADRAVKLYKSGLSAKMVAEKLGYKPATVNYWLRERGVTRTLKQAQRLRREREGKTQ